MHDSIRIGVSVAGVLLGACVSSRTEPPERPLADASRVQRDVDYLASDALQGRATGSAGNDSAAAYLAARYGSLGLQSPYPGFLQRFAARSAMTAHTSAAALATQNVVAFLPGSNPTLRGQAIVIGAHFDHLGRGAFGALDPQALDAIRNGADDNASGTAAVLELARLLRAHPTRRSVIFANFSAEELGLLGSQYFVEHPPIPLDSIVAMINFDMVGRLRGDSLIVYGVATARELPSLVDSANASLGLEVRGVGDGFGPSDQSSFFAKGIPVLHFFTNLHEDYHRATDDAHKLNAAGVVRIVALAERVVREIDERDQRLTFVRGVAPQPVAGGRPGTGAYLGSIPDMSAGDEKGLRLTGVTAGSPADSAGIRAGDLVVEFSGRPVTDLRSYSDALYSHKPGDEVEIVVIRNGDRLTLRARLGRRR